MPQLIAGPETHEYPTGLFTCFHANALLKRFKLPIVIPAKSPVRFENSVSIGNHPDLVESFVWVP